MLIGLGFGLIYLPAIVSVGFYFERQRSFAMGIAVCGSGLGTLVFPAIMPYVINAPLWFDYEGALLLEAAIIFICIIFGTLMVFNIFINKFKNKIFFRFRYHKIQAK